MLDLEAHVQEYLQDKTRGPWLREDSVMLQELTESTEPIDTIHHSMCALQLNKFGVILPYDKPGAKVFHPLPSLINHSCSPNATTRMDVSILYTQTSSPNPIVGSISIHATRKISKGEEVFHTYIDHTQSTEERQASLRHSYFFACSCSRCQGPGATLQSSMTRNAAVSFAKAILNTGELMGSAGLEHTVDVDAELIDKIEATRLRPQIIVPTIRLTMTALARENYPLDKAPFPSLRETIPHIRDHEILLRADMSRNASEAVPDAEDQVVAYLILVYRVYDAESQEMLPLEKKLAFQWRQFCWLAWLMQVEAPLRKITRGQLGILFPVVLDDLAEAVLTPEQLNKPVNKKEAK